MFAAPCPEIRAEPSCSGAAMEDDMQIKRTPCLLGLALVATAAIAGQPHYLRAPSASL